MKIQKTKMIRLAFLLLLSGIGIQMSAQNQITGKIYNSKTKELMPYVSLGIEAKATGTVSDRDGMFLLKIGDIILASDSITFSHIGFSTVKYSVSDLTGIDNEIFLEPKEFELAEVVVTAKKFRERKLGRTHVGLKTMHAAFFSVRTIDLKEQLSAEMGLLFKIRNECRINSLNFYMSGNGFENVKFRLTFYSIEDDLPKDVIVNRDIIFDVTDKYTGWFNLDLKPYEIFISGHEQIAATLTILENDSGFDRNNLSLSGAMLPYFTTFARSKAMDEWKKYNQAISMYLEVTEFRD